ncbi:tryptophan synthase subunit beta [Persicobacter diffluens]|uniref:Tryptophan synthase beta chain n=1 Tax=Persicobacter diffluens TaxID=981 RepID=A0AAN4VXZ7_9BACT|nr:tryptophan synthase beta chain 2 [Persicobacter diffluens]
MDFLSTPDAEGFFGSYGGSFLPAPIQKEIDKITEMYLKLREDASFWTEINSIRKHYQGRPTPLYYCNRLSKAYQAHIYLKREDLNHTGAHKLNHCMAEALLAKKMGKNKLIAETGAGQHGVALATAAAYFGLSCEIHMGEVDIQKEKPNVDRMIVLGAKVIPATHGLKTLKEAVDNAFEAYLKDPEKSIYCIGSVVGPHPFPMMVRDFQAIVGQEVHDQYLQMLGKLPDHIVACVGGGSNAIGMFSAFLDERVELHGVEPAGKGIHLDGQHAATLTKGKRGMIHGFKCYNLEDEKGEPLAVHSIASGLDYPGVGPEHCMLKDSGRVDYVSVTDEECIQAFYELSQLEGIIPALESAHALAYAKTLGTLDAGANILVNLSGRGDKDLEYVLKNFPAHEYYLEEQESNPI